MVLFLMGNNRWHYKTVSITEDVTRTFYSSVLQQQHTWLIQRGIVFSETGKEASRTAESRICLKYTSACCCECDHESYSIRWGWTWKGSPAAVHWGWVKHKSPLIVTSTKCIPSKTALFLLLLLTVCSVMCEIVLITKASIVMHVQNIKKKSEL